MSEGGIFETAAGCSVDAPGVLILKSMYKILFGFIVPSGKTPYYLIVIMFNAVIALMAAVIVFIAFRFLRYREQAKPTFAFDTDNHGR